MTPQGDEEFYFALIVWGGIIFAGVMVSIGLTMVGIAVKNKINKRKLANEIYNEKERSNGQHKSGARGKW